MAIQSGEYFDVHKDVPGTRNLIQHIQWELHGLALRWLFSTLHVAMDKFLSLTIMLTNPVISVACGLPILHTLAKPLCPVAQAQIKPPQDAHGLPQCLVISTVRPQLSSK